MKLIELRPQRQIDLMSTMMLGQSMYAQFDDSLSNKDEELLIKKAQLLGAIFCGTAITLSENGFMVSPSLMSIGESDSRDGVYVYATTNNEQFTLKMDKRIPDGFCIYGTINLDEPKLEIYYGEELAFNVVFCVDGLQVVPKIEEHESSLSDELRKLISDSINEHIMKIHISFAAGFKAGMEAAAEEEGIDNE